MWKAEMQKKCPCRLTHTYDLSSWEVEAGRSQVQGQLGLQGKIPNSEDKRIMTIHL